MNLFEEYTALDNVVIALPQVRARGFSVTCALAADPAAHDRAQILLERVGLMGSERTNVRSLSYVERRALEFGVAPATEQRLMFVEQRHPPHATPPTARPAAIL